MAKNKLRKEIRDKGCQYTTEDLSRMSEEVFSVLELTGAFNDASHICIYNAMKDEVATHPFISKWIGTKKFYLPVIENDEIIFRNITKDTRYEKSSYGIHEPLGDNLTDYARIDLTIVPGVAFDRKGNRLGRGKGYYDRFLPKTKAPKVGVCFDYQLLNQIPTDTWDVKMDIIVSENDLIW